jgi:aspartate-semialdehyde dehydrogenase
VSKKKALVLGATGTIGQTFLRQLEDHPWFELSALAASDRSAGTRLRDRRVLLPLADWVIDETILDVNKLNFKQYDLVFSGLPSDVAGELEIKAAKAGARVFSNASSHRYDKDVPILCPDVNGEHLQLCKEQGLPGSIVTNSNCTVMGVVVPLAPIKESVKRVHVVSYQALSGAGYPGVPSLDAAGNVIPYIEKEEEKVAQEALKILGTLQRGAVRPWPVEVTAQCARVPVRDGHTIALSAELKEELSVEEIASRLSSFRGEPQKMELPTAPRRPIIIRSEKDRPQPAHDAMAGEPERARGMAVSVGRLKRQGNLLMMYTLSHNLIRGGAGASVLNAEYAMKKGLFH